MDLQAYVKGDITVVTEILSQVAMVTSSDNFLGALTLSMIVGFAVSLLQGLLRGGQFSIMGFFIPAFLFTVAIVPKADLVIENDRTGAISRIDDIPIGIAAPIYLITFTGHEITEMMETALGVSDTRLTTDNGVLFATRAPLAYKWMLTQPEVLDIDNKGVVGPDNLHVYHDTRAYILDCVAPQLATGRVAYSEVTSGDINTTLRVNNSARVVTTSGGMSCEDAFDELNAGMASPAFLDGLEVVLNNYFKRYEGDTTIGPRYRAALQSLVDDEADYIKSIVWLEALSSASAQFKGQGGGESATAALNDALIQRLENNRGSAAIVFETMNMTIAFLEAWSFAIMPIMLLVLVFGSIGWSLAAKYFWLLVWIQLWHLTILIVLDFMQIQARVLPNSNVDSIAAGRNFLEHAMRLEDIGYMMLSMATMLSMALIYGSSAVFATGLQRAIAGADHYDEKKVFADSLSRAPTNAMRSSFEHTPSGGWQGAGAASAFGGMYFSMDRSRSNGVSNADLISIARGTTSSAGRNLNVQEGYQRSEGRQEQDTRAESDGVSTTTARSLATQAGLSNAGSFGAQLTTTEGQNVQTSGQAGVKGDAGFGVGKFGAGVSAGLQGSASTTDSRAIGNTVGNTTTNSDEFRLGDRMDVSRQQGTRTESSESSNRSDGRSEQGSTTDVASRQRSESSQSSESFQANSSEATRASVGTGSVSGISVANNIAQDPELFDQFVRAVSQAGIAGEVENMIVSNHSELARTFKDSDAMYAFAGMYVMQGMGGHLAGRTGEQIDALNALGDDFLEAVTFGGGFDLNSTVDNGELRLMETSGSSPTEAMTDLGLRIGTNRAALDGRLDAASNPVNMMDTFRSELTTMGAASDEMMGEQVHGAFSSARRNLDDRHQKLTDPNNWLERVREDGWVDGIASSVGLGTEEDKQLAALGGLYRKDRSPEGPAGTLNARLERFEQATGGDTPQLLSEYMALEQLRVGAENIGLHDDASTFEQRMLALEAENPALGGESGQRIRELARDASTLNGFTDRMQLAQAELEYGETKARTEEQLGFGIVDDGTRNPPEFAAPRGPAYDGALRYNFMDVDQGARTLVAEAGNQGYDGMLAVANVIRNRVEDGSWGDSVAEVVHAPNQFSAWNAPENGGNALGYETGPGDPRYEQAKQIMESVLRGEAPDITGGATHYYSPEGMQAYIDQGIQSHSEPPWWDEKVAERGGDVVQIGDHLFAGMKR